MSLWRRGKEFQIRCTKEAGQSFFMNVKRQIRVVAQNKMSHATKQAVIWWRLGIKCNMCGKFLFARRTLKGLFSELGEASCGIYWHVYQFQIRGCV